MISINIIYSSKNLALNCYAVMGAISSFVNIIFLNIYTYINIYYVCKYTNSGKTKIVHQYQSIWKHFIFLAKLK